MSKTEPGRIVVGVDGSDPSMAALRWAVGEASLRGATVEAVRAWHYPYLADAAATATMPDVRDAIARGEQEGLDAAVATLGGSASGVNIEPRLVYGSAAAALVELSSGAELLVVGSRGHGGFVGLLLGSTSQQCAHHAHCPVVVVPHTAT